MLPYGVETTVLLPAATPVVALFSALLGEDVYLYVVQTNLVCLLRNDEIVGQLTIDVKRPMCLVQDNLIASSCVNRRLVKFSNRARKLRCEAIAFRDEVDHLASSRGEFFFSSSGRRIHRHSQNNNQLLRTFSAKVEALASINDDKLLIVLPHSLHLMDPQTNQDLLEVPSDVANPVDIIWTGSLEDNLWFASLVRPEPMSSVRQHKMFMTELQNDIASSVEITPDGVDTNKTLVCRMRGNKLACLAENGNVVLVMAMQDLRERSLLYRAEATDIPFTAVEILGETKAATPPSLAVGTSNGAVAFFNRTITSGDS